MHPVGSSDSGNMKDDLLKFDKGRNSGTVSEKYLLNLKGRKERENWNSMIHENVKVWSI